MRSHRLQSGRGHLRRGIYRLEVLTLTVLALLLLAVLVPAISQARRNARQTQSVDRLRIVYGKLSEYHDTYRSFPASSGPKPASQGERRPPTY